MEAFRVVYLVSGLLFLAVALLGGAWWELVLGEPAKPVLYVGLSPFGIESELFGSQAIETPPVLNALLLAFRALAILGASTIVIGAMLEGRPWSKKLLNLRPLTMSIGFAILVAATTMLLPRFLSTAIPQLAQLTPNLNEAFAPYSSGRLRINLYPLTRVNSSLDLAFKSQLTLNFWIASLSGALCLAGWVLTKKRARETLGEAKPVTEEQPPITS